MQDESQKKEVDGCTFHPVINQSEGETKRTME